MIDSSPTMSASIGKLATDLAKAQGMIVGAIKDSNNPYFKSKYADIASVWDACRKALSTNNLALVQTTNASEEGHIVIITTLMHTSGEWFRGYLPIKPTKSDPQALGSAITYGRRYALAAMVGVAQIDDDGNAACVDVDHKTATRDLTGDIEKLRGSKTMDALKRGYNALVVKCDASQLTALMQVKNEVKLRLSAPSQSPSSSPENG